MKPIHIPVIKSFPAPIPDIVGVQPMMAPYDGEWKFKICDETRQDKEGDIRHMFGEGWQVYYGNEWIPMSIWWKIKIKGL